MEAILRSLDLLDVWQAFSANNVGPKEAIHLSDKDFERLGVSKVGDRIRIKQKCLAEVDKNAKRLRQFVTNRRLKKGVKRCQKPTRKIYAGWKHDGGAGVSKQVTTSRGGGSHPLDLPRSASMQEVEQELCSLFFPGGRNEAQNLDLDGVDRRVTTFSGKCVMDFDLGESITLNDLVDVMKTNPVRIYLETSLKNNGDDDGGGKYSDDVDSSSDGDAGLPDINILSDGGMKIEAGGEDGETKDNSKSTGVTTEQAHHAVNKYFKQLQAEQLRALKKHHDEEIEAHEREINRHEESINRLRKRKSELSMAASGTDLHSIGVFG